MIDITLLDLHSCRLVVVCASKTCWYAPIEEVVVCSSSECKQFGHNKRADGTLELNK